MRRLTYENPIGEKISFYLSPLLIESLVGIAETDADIQGQSAPYQDGDTYIDTKLQPRYITLEGSIVPTDLPTIQVYRSSIISVLNPKLGLGKITLEKDGLIKQIQGISDGVPFFPERGQGAYQKFLVNFKCPYPYWQSVEQISEPMTAYIGLFKFPFTLPTQFGTVGSKQTFINDGGVATPVQIEFRGPATNPRVTNKTTGEFIQVNRELLEGDRLVVDTTFGNKRVVIINKQGNETNVLNWIDLNSTFWQLIPGENEIEYTADAGRENAIVAITWRNRYLGI